MEKQVKLVHKGSDVVLFEEGYWMKRKDYDKQWPEVFYKRTLGKIGWDVDKKTKQITPFYLP